MSGQQNDVMSALAQALAPYLSGGMLAKATGNPVIPPDIYAEGGLFGSCKNDPVLINAIVGPIGYMARMRWTGDIFENPITESLTFIRSTGYDQTGLCDDCGKPYIKRCAQSTCFGRICQQTEEMAFDALGLRANAGVPVLAFYGNITDPQGQILIRQGEQVQNLFTLQVVAAAYNLRRRIGQLIWSGNPAASVGGYQEFNGFDLLINTGKVDALTGNACTALDSYILNYGNAIVGAAGAPSIVQYVATIIRRVRNRIAGAGFDPDSSTTEIVISPTLVDCFFNAWACEYGLVCPSVGITMNNDALAVAKLRDDFRNGLHVPVDGKLYNVVIDNGITVVNRPVGNDTARCSTIYVITREIAGAPNGGTVTWGEFQDMQATAGNVVSWFQQMFGSTIVSVTDGGRFAVAPTTSGGFCFDARILTKPRVRMLMPWTSGRVTNVCCTELIPTPDVTGSGGLYEVGCGATTTPPNYLYGDCWPDHTGDGRGQ
jgi:hypothetical protein